jgi:hypothetical protein
MGVKGIMTDVGFLRSLRIGMGIDNSEERKRMLRIAADLERLRIFDLALALSDLPHGTLWCVGSMEDGPFARIVWPQPDGGYSGGYREATGETAAEALRFAAASASVGRNAERQDNADWLGPEDEHATRKGDAQ